MVFYPYESYRLMKGLRKGINKPLNCAMAPEGTALDSVL